VKAGGMRITQHKNPKDEKEGKVTKEKVQVEEGSTTLKLSTGYVHLFLRLKTEKAQYIQLKSLR
jgi:hypothetical protein